MRESLQDEDVHVWTTTLEVRPASVDACWSVLSGDERRRAEAFRFPDDRRRYVTAHGLLRILLGRYTGHPPHELAFRLERHGKPRLATAPGIEFSISHSHERAAIAVATRPVGVDIERVRPVDDAGDVAKRFFSAVEVEALQGCERAEFIDRFYGCWTRKEAYVKARGEGLSKALNSFAVSVVPDDPRLIEDQTDPSAIHQWSFRDVRLDGYIGAVVALGAVRRLRQVNWHERGIHS